MAASNVSMSFQGLKLRPKYLCVAMAPPVGFGTRRYPDYRKKRRAFRATERSEEASYRERASEGRGEDEDCES
jgi:hypothetical protein